ncbi:MAG TPA: hypothetical protein VEH27_12575 [Methylomirabilota bacterium]|nr:hypothetical protein [Methylomirabilota bacterium]
MKVFWASLFAFLVLIAPVVGSGGLSGNDSQASISAACGCKPRPCCATQTPTGSSIPQQLPAQQARESASLSPVLLAALWALPTHVARHAQVENRSTVRLKKAVPLFTRNCSLLI